MPPAGAFQDDEECAGGLDRSHTSRTRQGERLCVGGGETLREEHEGDYDNNWMGYI